MSDQNWDTQVHVNAMNGINIEAHDNMTITAMPVM